MVELIIMAEKNESDRLPFPTARITRQIRSKVKDKMISSKVKVATNQFLGDLTAIIAKDMDAQSEKTIKLSTFEKAARPYTYADRIKEEEEEVVNELEKVRMRMDKLIRDFRSKFEIVDDGDFKVGHDLIDAEEKKDKPKSIGEMTIDELEI